MFHRYLPLTLVVALVAACGRSGNERGAADSAAAARGATPPDTTPPPETPPESTSTAASDSSAGRKPRPSKSGVTDTGYREPRESLRVKPPERRPNYPPLKHPLSNPDSTTKRDTTGSG